MLGRWISERLPAWFLFATLSFFAVAIIWQMYRGDAIRCSNGAIFARSCGETTVPDNLVIWDSDPFRLSAGEQETITHSLNTIPSFVQIWSAPEQDGPRSLIDSIIAPCQSGICTYGIWIHSVDDKKLEFSSGKTSATSTYGAVNHWDLYHGGKYKYSRNAVWFKVTAIAGKS